LVCVSVNAAIDKTAAVPRLVAGEIHRPQMLSVLPGGKALNVARAARTLGLEASVIAVLGGCAGDWMEQQLAARGIRTRAVRVPGETRTCLSILDREKGGLTEFYEAGLELRTKGWAAVESALRAELADDPSGALVVIAGSLPPGAPLDGYGRLSGIAAELGARAAVDVGGGHLTAALPFRPWMVKVNAREATEACGTAEGADAGEGGSASPDGAGGAALELRRRGATVALVTLGTRGAVLVDEAGRRWLIGPPPELGPFPVGSGDALLAGMAAALARGLPLPEAAREGAAAACANALRPGQGELDRADVARVLAGISLAQM
jgi:1-phosphofructokinase family hexose kinase